MNKEALEPTKERKGRGPGKKPRLLCTSLRLPVHVMEYFDKHHEYSKQAKIREILVNYVNQQTGANNA
jgi:hypothetical protein